MNHLSDINNSELSVRILLIIMVVCLILIVVGIPLTIVLVHKYKNDHFEDYYLKK